MVMEYWCGWFDVWGEPHHVFHAEGTETHRCHQWPCHTLHTSGFNSFMKGNSGFRPRSRTSWLTERRRSLCCTAKLPLWHSHLHPSWLGHFLVWWFSDMLAVVSEILERGVSVNFYMFHGGSNFGFMNGAMDFGTYRPQVSSYGGFRNRESTWGNVTTPVSVMQFCLPLFIAFLPCRLWRSTVRGRRLHPEISPPEAFIQPVPL